MKCKEYYITALSQLVKAIKRSRRGRAEGGRRRIRRRRRRRRKRRRKRRRRRRRRGRRRKGRRRRRRRRRSKYPWLYNSDLSLVVVLLLFYMEDRVA